MSPAIGEERLKHIRVQAFLKAVEHAKQACINGFDRATVLAAITLYEVVPPDDKRIQQGRQDLLALYPEI